MTIKEARFQALKIWLVSMDIQPQSLFDDTKSVMQ